MTTEQGSGGVFEWQGKDILSDPIGELSKRLALLVKIREADLEMSAGAAWLLAEQLIEAKFCIDLAERLLGDRLNERTTALRAEIARQRGDLATAAKYTAMSEEFFRARPPRTEKDQKWDDLTALAGTGELGLIRFGGHLSKQVEVVHGEREAEEAAAAAA